MIYESFPDLGWVKKQAESGFSNRKAWNGKSLSTDGWPTVILNVKAAEIYRDNIPGPLSFFTTVSGTSTVHTEGYRTEIPRNCFFLTNPGQRYTLEIANTQAETFNVHFGEKWAEKALASMVIKTDILLDQPDKIHELNFFNKLFVKNANISGIIQTIKASKAEGVLNEDALLYQLLEQILVENNLLKESARNAPVSKASTREEILKRLFRATDYIYAHYSDDISLDKLAEISCLSKFHFLRLFRQIMGQTPHQFCTAVRIEKAKELLKAKNVTVKTVASTLGFSSPGTFSRLFNLHVGVYPTQFISCN